jgi:hypothetical protein
MVCVMTAKSNDEYSDEEAQRRADNALRHALTTPYKPQRELVGKTQRAKAMKRKRKKAKKG